MDLLPAYFQLRGRWFMGSKAGLRALSERETEIHALFIAAIRNTADHQSLERLVKLCVPE